MTRPKALSSTWPQADEVKPSSIKHSPMFLAGLGMFCSCGVLELKP